MFPFTNRIAGARSQLLQHAYRRTRAPAFTVLELLVCVVVIALLTALTLTVNKRIRHSADKVTNAHKLRSIGVAVFAYAADHNGKTPPNTRDGLVTRTIGNGMSSGTALRKLYGQKTFSPVGQGTFDYLGSPDCLYGPFTELITKARNRGTFFYSREAGTYRSGYCAYNLPRFDQKGMPPELEECFNDRITENPRVPLYSDHINWAEFSGSEIAVLYLDGSLRSFSKKEIDERTTWKARLRLFMGIQ